MDCSSTRRELVGSAMAAAVGASGLLGADLAEAAAAPRSDAGVLWRTLKIERLVVIAYREVLSSGTLSPANTHKVQAILGQELQHVAIVERALKKLGGTPPPAPRDLPAAQRALASHHVTASLTDLHTQTQCLRLLVDTETLAEDAYFVAIEKLMDPALLRLCAQIMGCEAQHWTVLSSARHGDIKITVPYPFVGGPT